MSSGMQVSNREESIRARAYELWESEGRPEGKHFEHWRRSELETAQEASAAPLSENQSPPVRRAKSKGKKPRQN